MDKQSKISDQEDSTKIGPSVALNLVDLSTGLNQTENSFHKSRDTQGFMGRSYDWMKNNLGGSYETGSWVARRWSNVLNYDMGSEGIQRNIDRTKELLLSNDTTKIAKELQLEEGRVNLKATKLANEFNADQEQGVKMLADTATIASMALTRGKGSHNVFDLAMRGAVVKSGLKALDGTYSKPLDDAMTGAFMGAMTPVAISLGKSSGFLVESAPTIKTLSEALQSRTVNAFSFGVEGAVIGHTQQISSIFEQQRQGGERAYQAFWKANIDSLNNPTGAAIGLAGGALGGFLLGKARVAKSEVPPSPSNPPNGPRSPLAPAGNSAEGLEIPKSPNEPIKPSPGPYPKGPTSGDGSASAEVELKIPLSPRGPIEPIGPKSGPDFPQFQQAAALDIPKSSKEAPVYLIQRNPEPHPKGPVPSGTPTGAELVGANVNIVHDLNPARHSLGAASSKGGLATGKRIDPTIDVNGKGLLNESDPGSAIGLASDIKTLGAAGRNPDEKWLGTFLEKFVPKSSIEWSQIREFSTEYARLNRDEQVLIQQALSKRNSINDRMLLIHLYSPRLRGNNPTSRSKT